VRPKQIKRQQASNHANQHKLMNFETGPASQNPKAPPRLAEAVAWLGRPQRGGAVLFNWNCQKTKLSSTWQFQEYMAVAIRWAVPAGL